MRCSFHIVACNHLTTHLFVAFFVLVPLVLVVLVLVVLVVLLLLVVVVVVVEVEVVVVEVVVVVVVVTISEVEARKKRRYKRDNFGGTVQARGRPRPEAWSQIQMKLVARNPISLRPQSSQ